MGILTRWLERQSARNALLRMLPRETRILETYDRAIAHVGVPGTADQLAQFRNEHAKHLEDLLAGAPTMARRISPRVRASLSERLPGWAGPIAFDGTEGALSDVLHAERKNAIAWGHLRGKLSPDIAALIARVHDDTTRHIRFLSKMIETRVWEQAPNPDFMG